MHLLVQVPMSSEGRGLAVVAESDGDSLGEEETEALGEGDAESPAVAALVSAAPPREIPRLTSKSLDVFFPQPDAHVKTVIAETKSTMLFCENAFLNRATQRPPLHSSIVLRCLR